MYFSKTELKNFLLQLSLKMYEHIKDTSCPSPHQVAIGSMSRLRVMQASDAEDRDIRSDKLKPEYGDLF